MSDPMDQMELAELRAEVISVLDEVMPQLNTVVITGAPVALRMDQIALLVAATCAWVAGVDSTAPCLPSIGESCGGCHRCQEGGAL